MANNKQKLLFQLPHWIPLEAWNAYLDMRKTIKKPMTEYAMQLAIKKLWQFKEQGMSVQEVLDQSTFNTWQGLFPVQNTMYNGRTNGKSEQLEINRDDKYRRIASGVIGISQNNGTGLQGEPKRTGSSFVDGANPKLLQ